jgi:hypothetical protein
MATNLTDPSAPFPPSLRPSRKEIARQIIGWLRRRTGREFTAETELAEVFKAVGDDDFEVGFQLAVSGAYPCPWSWSDGSTACTIDGLAAAIEDGASQVWWDVGPGALETRPDAVRAVFFELRRFAREIADRPRARIGPTTPIAGVLPWAAQRRRLADGVQERFGVWLPTRLWLFGVLPTWPVWCVPTLVGCGAAMAPFWGNWAGTPVAVACAPFAGGLAALGLAMASVPHFRGARTFGELARQILALRATELPDVRRGMREGLAA